MTNNNLANKIDALLPQTQCRQCEYTGCKPYADAIANKGEAIDRCIPGGVRVLKELAELTQQDASQFIKELVKKEKPPVLAVINEAVCIGCTKCIQACPVDAILGAGKLMHTVIADDCTGCELCIEPCPVDCIDLTPTIALNETEQLRKANLSRERYQRHQLRLEESKKKSRAKHQKNKAIATPETNASDLKTIRKNYIADALARVKKKRDPS